MVSLQRQRLLLSANRRTLELLAPARDYETGVAAIDCGADAVYIAGPAFGARAAAGNSMEDIRQLCRYAHKFGVRIYLTLNTILYDSELKSAQSMAKEAVAAGVDAIIVQDLSLLKMDIPPIPLHASTQTRIRSVEDALFLQNLGFERIILERNLSLNQIEEICSATDVEVEAFVHGAICVSYSGNCYLSCAITGRSANRGECIQACRNRWNLVDSTGKAIVKEKPLLSLKDYNLSEYIPQMARAGVCSFKIEGRLKNISYVRNTVTHYNRVLNGFIAANPSFRRSSMLQAAPPATTDINATFNRGFTTLFINGRRGHWLSGESAKHIGQLIGCVEKPLSSNRFLFSPLSQVEKGEVLRKTVISNGDGLCIEDGRGGFVGLRANSVEGNVVTCRFSTGDSDSSTPAAKGKVALRAGAKVYRNYDIVFERELERAAVARMIPVELAVNGEGVKVFYNKAELFEHKIELPFTQPNSIETARASLLKGLGKSAGVWSFKVISVEGEISFYRQSEINQVRRDIAQRLDYFFTEIYEQERSASFRRFERLKAEALKVENEGVVDYRANVANHLAAGVYQQAGVRVVGMAFELNGGCHRSSGKASCGAELMRTKYCIRYELGACLKKGGSAKFPTELFLENSGRRFALEFDCANCEMVVKY